MLLKRGDGGDPEIFTTLSGFRDRSFDLTTNEVDTTAQDASAPTNVPPQKTSAPGLQSRSFNVDLSFEDDVSGKETLDDARLARVNNYQVIWPGYGTFEGPFFWTSFTGDGPLEGELGITAVLVPNAALTFTPVS